MCPKFRGYRDKLDVFMTEFIGRNERDWLKVDTLQDFKNKLGHKSIPIQKFDRIPKLRNMAIRPMGMRK